MLTRARTTLVCLALSSSALALAETPPARVVTAPEAKACLARLVIVTGLAGDDKLTIGGDQHVVLAHDRSSGSRYWAFSQLGYATLDKPWPARGSSLDFLAIVDGVEHRYHWMLRGGRMQAEATGPSAKKAPKPDVTFRSWRALDDDAWTLIARIVTLKLPMVMKSLEEQRAYSAKKHMTFSVALGHEDAYRDCTNLGPGTIGEKLDDYVRRAHAAWKKLAEAPIENERYELVRRADHREWRMCESTADCVLAAGPCGVTDVIARSAKAQYASWRATREEQLNCERPDEGEHVVAACVAKQCVDRDIAAQPWATCRNDAECSVSMACDQPMAVSSGVGGTGPYWRMRWWNTVDGWDRCSNGNVAVPANVKARCTAGRCQLVP